MPFFSIVIIQDFVLQAFFESRVFLTLPYYLIIKSFLENKFFTVRHKKSPSRIQLKQEFPVEVTYLLYFTKHILNRPSTCLRMRAPLW